jgi:murein DD-endopeptidase MepM/ murein hydrolase activator NlpD
VSFERVVRDGQFAGYGDVLAATLHNQGRTLTAIRYPGPDGKPAWYDEHGRSLKRQFLRSPLPFDPQITSGFSQSRLHPIYGDYRAHLGVDYAAPYGTAVIAVAAGVVEVAEMAGDAGRMIQLRHAGGYETAYLHLSAFAPGIQPGVHVEQGQVIGRVGQSGAATGPHLDFRFKKDGVYVNPVLEARKLPPGEPIARDVFDAFARQRDRVFAGLRTRLAELAARPRPLPRPAAHH